MLLLTTSAASCLKNSRYLTTTFRLNPVLVKFRFHATYVTLSLHLKVIEEPSEPSKFREIGICTEKWVEVIKASKQTDTEDFAFKVKNQQIKVNKQLKCKQNFAFKDTESPRVADMVFEPSPERVVMERRSSLRDG